MIRVTYDPCSGDLVTDSQLEDQVNYYFNFISSTRLNNFNISQFILISKLIEKIKNENESPTSHVIFRARNIVSSSRRLRDFSYEAVMDNPLILLNYAWGKTNVRTVSECAQR